MNRKLKGNLILLLTAIIWGTSFVAQRVGVAELAPSLFIGIRSLIGAVVLIPVIFIFSAKKLKDKKILKETLKSGIICGVILCLASNTQTWGMVYDSVTAGKAGFITALYMVFVPIVLLFFGKKLNLRTVAGVIIAVIGMYLLCMTNEKFTFGTGELLVLVCAILYTFHILTIDHYSETTDGVIMSFVQFAVCGIISLIYYFIVHGTPNGGDVSQNWLPLLYSGAMSCGIAYTLQVIGQKYADPTPASIIMSLESVFAAVGGWIILSEDMSAVEIIGCLIMFAAIIIVQLPDKSKSE